MIMKNERKRFKTTVTDDISDTGLTHEEFKVLSEHYADNENIYYDSDSSAKPDVETQQRGNFVIAHFDDSIIDILSKHHAVSPRVLRSLLNEYESMRPTKVRS